MMMTFCFSFKLCNFVFPKIQFTHLQHAPFEYRISATNNSRAPRQGTCRIFLCPRFDERGQTLRFRDQRSVLIEMDKFYVTCESLAGIIAKGQLLKLICCFCYSESWTKHHQTSLRRI